METLLTKLGHLIEAAGFKTPPLPALTALADQATATARNHDLPYSYIDCALVIAYKQLRQALDDGDLERAREVREVIARLLRWSSALTHFPNA